METLEDRLVPCMVCFGEGENLMATTVTFLDYEKEIVFDLACENCSGTGWEDIQRVVVAH